MPGRKRPTRRLENKVFAYVGFALVVCALWPFSINLDFINNIGGQPNSNRKTTKSTTSHLRRAIRYAFGSSKDKDSPPPAGVLLPALEEGRSQRFPSIEERVRLYMAHWYAPPCNSTFQVVYQFNATDQSVAVFRQQALWDKSESNITDNATTTKPMGQRMGSDPDLKTFVFINRDGYGGNCTAKYNQTRSQRFCLDVQKTIPRPFFWDERIPKHEQPPVIINTADGSYPFFAPNLQKTRRALTQAQVQQITTGVTTDCQVAWHQEMQQQFRKGPILWYLNSHRHFTPMQQVVFFDIAWEHKKDVAVFRGALTGRKKEVMKNPNLTIYEKCLGLIRCRLVYNHANSKLIDAKLTAKSLENVINGVNLVQPGGMPMKDLLQYKALIFLEGNDISSGLKWGMLSRSVVLMPPPTMTSFAMEERLQPYVHYVPLFENLTNAEEQMQWILDHDEQAQKIALQGSLWMQDLFFHPQAAEDNRAIFETILHRYAAHYQLFSASSSSG